MSGILGGGGGRGGGEGVEWGRAGLWGWTHVPTLVVGALVQNWLRDNNNGGGVVGSGVAKTEMGARRWIRARVIGKVGTRMVGGKVGTEFYGKVRGTALLYFRSCVTRRGTCRHGISSAEAAVAYVSRMCIVGDGKLGVSRRGMYGIAEWDCETVTDASIK